MSHTKILLCFVLLIVGLLGVSLLIWMRHYVPPIPQKVVQKEQKAMQRDIKDIDEVRRWLWDKSIQIIIDDKIVVDGRINDIDQCTSYFLGADSFKMGIPEPEATVEINVQDLIQAIEE